MQSSYSTYEQYESKKPPQENTGRTLLDSFGTFEKIPFALIYGFILGLSSPGLDAAWIAWVGLVPLLLLLRSIKKIPDAAIIGLSFGLGYHLVCLRFIWGLFPLDWLSINSIFAYQLLGLLWFAAALYQSVFFIGFSMLLVALPMRGGYLLHFKRPFFPYLIVVPLVWVFFQWVLGASPRSVGIPVDQLVYSQTHFLPLLQLAKLGGSQLVEILIVLTNAAIANLLMEVTNVCPGLSERVDRLSNLGGAYLDLSIIAVLIVVIVNWGGKQIEQEAGQHIRTFDQQLLAEHPKVSVSVIQPNIPVTKLQSKTQSLNYSNPDQESDFLDVLLANANSQLIVLPEEIVDSRLAGSRSIEAKLLSKAVNSVSEVIFGANQDYSSKRINCVRMAGHYQLDSRSQEEQGLYVKRRLNPYGEYVPFGGENLPQEWRGLLAPLNERYLAVRGAQLFSSIWGKIGASINLEVAYPALVSDSVRKGASLLVFVANFNWFHNSNLGELALAMTQLRAIENGRYVVLATNSGISAIVDPTGTILTRSLPAKRGIIMDSVQFLFEKTPFTKMWWL